MLIIFDINGVMLRDSVAILIDSTVTGKPIVGEGVRT